MRLFFYLFPLQKIALNPTIGSNAFVYARRLMPVNFSFFLENIGAKTLGSIAYITGPNRYKKVEDEWDTISDTFPARNSSTLPSFDQKTK